MGASCTRAAPRAVHPLREHNVLWQEPSDGVVPPVDPEVGERPAIWSALAQCLEFAPGRRHFKSYLESAGAPAWILGVWNGCRRVRVATVDRRERLAILRRLMRVVPSSAFMEGPNFELLREVADSIGVALPPLPDAPRRDLATLEAEAAARATIRVTKQLLAGIRELEYALFKRAADFWEAFSQSRLHRQYCAWRRQGVNTAQPGDFDWVSFLGAGSFGRVFRARRHQLREDYAIKVIPKSYVLRDAHEQCCAERDALATLRHPFLPELAYAFQTSRALFLAMTLSRVGSLQNVAPLLAQRANRQRPRNMLRSMLLLPVGGDAGPARSKLPEELVRFYVAELVCALDFLHCSGYAYGDLKPANVLLSDAGHILLADFGFVTRFDLVHTRVAHGYGTPAYRAPEVTSVDAARAVASGQQAQQAQPGGGGAPGNGTNGSVSSSLSAERHVEVGVTADVFALGVTMFELLAGRRPPIDGGIPVAPSGASRWPDSIPPLARVAIAGMMRSDARKRWTLRDVRGCDFFATVNWARTNAAHEPPPFVPSLPSLSSLAAADAPQFRTFSDAMAHVDRDDVFALIGESGFTTLVPSQRQRLFDRWNYVSPVCFQRELNLFRAAQPGAPQPPINETRRGAPTGGSRGGGSQHGRTAALSRAASQDFASVSGASRASAGSADNSRSRHRSSSSLPHRSVVGALPNDGHRHGMPRDGGASIGPLDDVTPTRIP